MNIFQIELTKQEAKIYDEVMARIDKTVGACGKFRCERPLKIGPEPPCGGSASGRRFCPAECAVHR